MSEPTITRRSALTTLGGAIMAVAAAALPIPAPVAAVPLAILPIVALESTARIVSMLVVFEGRLGVVVNPRLTDEATAVAWAERRVAAGEVFDIWFEDAAA